MTDDLDAFRSRQRRLTLDGIAHLPLEVAYTDVGAGEAVLLLHGIPTWSYLYHDVIPLLEPHCRVLAPDFLGHGYSDRRDCFDRSLVAQTRMVLAYLDALGIEAATIVGHDTGGGVALIMGIEHPGRVKRLVLANVVAYDSWPIDDMIDLGNPNWRDKPAAEVAAFVASGLPDGLHNAARLTPEFERNIVAPYSDEEARSA
jgi:pimeloyl-ACP methyl ester carboxylesterase